MLVSVGHSALLLADIAEQLDLSEVLAGLEDEAFGGRPGFDPQMLVRVWLFAYLMGIRSSRKLAVALVENIAFRMLANNQTPQYWALNRFRTRHRVALGNLLVQTITLASELGLMKLGAVAIDGTKIRAKLSLYAALYARAARSEPPPACSPRSSTDSLTITLPICPQTRTRKKTRQHPVWDGGSSTLAPVY